MASEITIGWGDQKTTYKVGDRVGFSRNEWDCGFGKITKINGHGHVTVEREREDIPDRMVVFDKEGNERPKSRYGFCMQTAASLEERIVDREERKRVNRAVESLKYGIECQRCVGGNYHIDAETKEALRALVDAI